MSNTLTIEAALVESYTEGQTIVVLYLEGDGPARERELQLFSFDDDKVHAQEVGVQRLDSFEIAKLEFVRFGQRKQKAEAAINTANQLGIPAIVKVGRDIFEAQGWIVESNDAYLSLFARNIATNSKEATASIVLECTEVSRIVTLPTGETMMLDSGEQPWVISGVEYPRRGFAKAVEAIAEMRRLAAQMNPNGTAGAPK